MTSKENEAAGSTPINPSAPLPPPPPSGPHPGVMTPPSPLPPGQLGQAGSGPPLPDTTYWKVVTPAAGCVAGIATAVDPQGARVPPPKAKSLLEAYLLGLPLGFLGAHHFYLGRPTFGVMYFFTFGLLGCGWLVDLARMPCLVAGVNRANREKHEQLQHLRHLLQQRRLQQGGFVPCGVVFVPFEPRSLLDAYILWFPFGLLGFHHFYLRNYVTGVIYHLTFGLLGIGWLVDLFRMPSLVRRANAPRIQNEAKPYNQCVAHVFALSPAGILGGHHFYLDRPLWGCLYLCTLGLVGVGWVFDWFRTSCLVKRAVAVRRGERSANRKYLDDAYLLCLPFGFTGLHHFYLRRYGWGTLYLLTLGILGIGWIVDWFRLPWLVRAHNADLELCRRLIEGGGGGGGGLNGSLGGSSSLIGSAGATFPSQGPGYPTVYAPETGYGYQQTTYPAVDPMGGAYPGPVYTATGYTAAAMAPPSYEASVNSNTTTDTPH